MFKAIVRQAGILQKSLRFRVIATALVVLASTISYSVWLAGAIGEGRATETIAATAPSNTHPSNAPSSKTSPSSEAAPEAGAQTLSAPPLTADRLRARLRASSAWIAVGVGAAAATALALLVIWLGLALTGVALGVVAIAVAAPLMLFEPTRAIGQVTLGVLGLTAGFSVLIRAVRAALGANRPVIAIARNVIDEAVRMKISLVFIIALIFLLAAMPRLLDADQPLRYRVQSFLQYSTTATFWTLALLTLFFSIATVTFEQRDRLIWQTMVKPVTPMMYLLGKWLGVAMLNLALLTVSATGVFLFVNHMRNLPAEGEIRPFLLDDGHPGVTKDRQILETDVLAARTGVTFDKPQIVAERVDKAVQQKLQEAIQRDYSLRDNPAGQRELSVSLRKDIITAAQQRYRVVPPGGRQTYAFSGLGAAASLDRPLTVRYRIDAGSDDPGALFRVTFSTRLGYITQQTPLGVATTFTLPPSVINDEGTVVLAVINGDPQLGAANPRSIRFPPGSFEVLYTSGTYESNFLRVAATMWIKLGFLGAVGVASATFLSFPVACLLTLLVLFAAESADFLRTSLEQYPLHDNTGKLDWVAVVMNLIANPIADAFATYSKLRPTAKLVDGRLIAWGELAKGLAMVGAWSAVALAGGWAIFRKRELAIYSGH